MNDLDKLMAKYVRHRAEEAIDLVRIREAREPLRIKLVCGSRAEHWEESIPAAEYIIHQIHSMTAIIAGGATGIDALAEAVAKAYGVPVLPMPAPWDEYERRGMPKHKAGPDRNTAMLGVLKRLRFCGYEVECVALPDKNSKGTWDMVNKCKAAGVAVTVQRLEEL